MRTTPTIVLLPTLPNTNNWRPTPEAQAGGRRLGPPPLALTAAAATARDRRPPMARALGEDVSSPRYGYGFQLDPQTGIVGHSGGFPGISSNLDIFKGTGYVAVVMANYGDAGQPVVDKIRSLVRARTTPTAQ